ncbi:prepilin-type N-terminal cleavage/methylation domain-containing protein [Desulfosporosinus acidiphilus SJ4]|uniref:Prepilin-type N-terminal cleavage/methylation domain-containing protein n=1 Tax=Desulfosporosinus acidiphilus (strain DSM 22704 / JCM 16185 / SJ4) TaxID=646529 RepID=I4D952_DESAJ|nr:prepilin-type N-terminal cleavage/methylation domain-containing protein [Desulfosporosinus acidiphilus]AFM42326.1 prepilin-type N-terminal cleavage/methylation domain-containing protein [Desulfosporosinus acidiphilus SJ4]
MKERGFTLIEIMLVLAVIGIIATVTLPKYQAVMDYYHLESSAQTVIGQLRYAKQLALDQRKEIYLAMDRTSVEVIDGDDKEYGGAQSLDSGVNFDASGAESQGLMINAGKAKGLPYVAYDARGFVENSPGSNGKINIVLSAVRTGSSVVIVLEIQTGNITVQW